MDAVTWNRNSPGMRMKQLTESACPMRLDIGSGYCIH